LPPVPFSRLVYLLGKRFGPLRLAFHAVANADAELADDSDRPSRGLVVLCSSCGAYAAARSALTASDKWGITGWPPKGWVVSLSGDLNDIKIECPACVDVRRERAEDAGDSEP
jgi:hypothetical protein